MLWFRVRMQVEVLVVHYNKGCDMRSNSLPPLSELTAGSIRTVPQMPALSEDHHEWREGFQVWAYTNML